MPAFAAFVRPPGLGELVGPGLVDLAEFSDKVMPSFWASEFA
jgi:hypothetical protein